MKMIFLVITALNNFANTTMSSLYFDITKDCLYASGKDSLERRFVATVLEQVKNSSLILKILILTIEKKGPRHHNEDNGSHPSLSRRRDSCDMES
jgi:isoleucyl-tRNA synthetase